MLFTTIGQFIVLGVLLLGGLLLGYACAPSTGKLKRRVREQSDSFTAYHADAENRAQAANTRAQALKTELDALRADHVEAQRTILDLRAAAAAAVAVPVAVVAEKPALSLVAAEPKPDAVVIADHPVAALPPEPIAAEAPRVAAEPDHVATEDATADVTPAEVAHDAEPEVEPTEPPVAEHPVDPTNTAHVEDAVIVPVAAPSMTPTPSTATPALIGPAEPEMPSKGWFASSARDELTRIRGIDEALNTRLFGMGVVRFEDLEKLSAEDEMALEQRLALPVGYIAREQWRTQAALLRAGQDDEHSTHFGAVEPAPVA